MQVKKVSSDWKALGTMSDGTPTTWSPCRSTHYVINPTGAPAGSDRFVHQAIKQVSDATGLVFVDDGTTDEPQNWDRPAFQPDRYGDRWAPVLISWGDVHDEGDGVVLGRAGPVTSTIGQRHAYVSGQVFLDAEHLGSIYRSGQYAYMRSVVAHELGHLVGLDHVDNDEEIMDSMIGSGKHFGAGDLTGLAAMGRDQCQPDL